MTPDDRDPKLDPTRFVPDETISDSYAEEASGRSRPSAVPPPAPTAPRSQAEFEVSLSDSGLMTKEDLAEFKRLLGRATSDDDDPRDMADALVEHEKLTRFQADVLLSGRVGLVLGNYVIQEKLGEGGMGIVYRAVHRVMNRTVAVKVLPQHLVQYPEAISRFHREVEAAAKLVHPNIAAAFDADEAGGHHFFVMEFVDGPNLSAYVKQWGPLPVGAVVHLMIQAARGLAQAHSQGVVHRDIKPSNLVVNRDGTLKVLDLGLAQLQDAGEDVTLTRSGNVMGTVDYMAPEQALNARRVDSRVDIYSLGGTLYFLLHGRPMMPDGSMTQKLLWHQSGDVPDLREGRPEIPKTLDRLFRRMVARDPDKRVESVAHVIVELEPLLEKCAPEDLALNDVGIRLQSGPGSTNSALSDASAAALHDVTRTRFTGGPRVQARGRKGLLAAVVVLALAAVSLGAILFLQNDGPDSTPEGPVADRAARPDRTAVPPDPETAESLMDRVTQTIERSAEDETESAGAEIVDPEKNLLSQVFLHGGSVTVESTEDGAPVKISSLEAMADHDGAPLLEIDLGGASLRDAELRDFVEIKGLQELSLSRTAVTDAGLSVLESYPNLNTLDLSETEISDGGLASVAGLSGLTDLDLGKTKITDEGMAALAGITGLQKLNLTGTTVGDAGLEKLSSLEKLRRLVLNGTSVTEAGYEALRTARSDLEIVWDGLDVERREANRLLGSDLRVTLTVQLGDEAGTSLKVEKKAELPTEEFEITLIDVSNNPSFGNEELAPLAELKGLVNLNVAGTGVTGASTENLCRLTTLEELFLGSTAFSEEDLLKLESCLGEGSVNHEASEDRTAAEWVLEQEGTVDVVASGEEITGITNIDGLPRGEFRLLAVNLTAHEAMSDFDLLFLEGLSGLERLYLKGKGLTDDGVSKLAGCTALATLSLVETSITSVGVAEIARFHSLRRLSLPGAKIDGEGLKALVSLPELTRLSLPRTELADEDLVHLKAMPKLQWLNLADVPVGDASLPFLQELDGLAELLVQGTEITDAGIEELTAKLPECKVRADDPDLQRLVAKWALFRKGRVRLVEGPVTEDAPLPRDACRILGLDLSLAGETEGAEIAKMIPFCTDLVDLDLSKTRVGDEELQAVAKLEDLRWLRLSGTGVTDAGLAALAGAGLEKIELLDLRGTQVTGAVFENWKLPALRHLSLERTPLTDAGLAHLAGSVALESLVLSRCGALTVGTFPSLANLSELSLLGLRGTAIDDAGLASLAPLTGLEQVDLVETGITDASLSTLTGWTGLKELEIAQTGLSEDGRGQLAEALPECEIPAEASRPEQRAFDRLRPETR